MPTSHGFSVILEPQDGGGFTVLVPALPEVVTEGDTEPEALANAEEAIRAVLAYRRDHLRREIDAGIAAFERGTHEEVDDADLDAWLDRLVKTPRR